MTRSWAVAAKELVEVARDRRALLLGFLLPVLAVPGLSAVLEWSTVRRLNAPARVAVADSRAADLLRSPDDLVEVVTAPDPEEALRTGRVAAVVEVSGGGQDGAPSEVVVRYRSRDPEGLLARERVARAVAQYSMPLVDRTLRAHGLDRDALTPVRLREEVVPGGPGWAGGLLPLLVVVWSFAGASLLAADLTAGEKERGTWDALRAAPVRRVELVVGKFAACWVAGVSLAVLASSVQAATAGSGTLGPGQLASLALAAASSSAVAGSAALAVGLASRSAREANQWTLPLYLAAVAAAAGVEALDRWAGAQALPVLNAALIARKAATGGLPDPSQVAWAVATSLASCGLLLGVCARLVDRE